MPVKKDETGRRWVEMEVLLHGTPEQIWQAVATGPGYATWFATTEIEEKAGGKLRFILGPEMASTGEVTVWEPPTRFGYVEREWNGDAPAIATEITIESRAGGTCVMRMVHSMFTGGDDWDDQMESFETGWPGFFAVLRLYLQHFAGKPGAPAQAVSFTEGRDVDMWSRLLNGLGLAGANVGDNVTLPAHPEALKGVVEHVFQDARQRYMILRIEAPLPAIALLGIYGRDAFQNVSATLFHYGDDAAARAQRSQTAWQSWLSTTFPGEARLVC